MGFFSDFIKSLTAKTAYLAGYGTRSVHINPDIGRDATCEAILDTNATHIARGQIVHVLKDADGRIKQVKRTSEYTKLFARPNPMMTAQEFKYAMAWQAQVTNTFRLDPLGREDASCRDMAASLSSVRDQTADRKSRICGRDSDSGRLTGHS